MSHVLLEAFVLARRALNDRHLGNPVIRGSLLETLASPVMYELAEMMGLGETSTTTLVLLVAGTDTYTVTIPSSKIGVRHIDTLTLTSQNWQLKREARDVLLATKEGPGGASARTGDPTHYAIWEEHTDTAQDATVLKLLLDPTPDKTDTLSAYWTHLPPRVGFNPGADKVPFSGQGFEAYWSLLASRAVRDLSDEELARLGVVRSIADTLAQQAARLASAERDRMLGWEHQSEVMRVND